MPSACPDSPDLKPANRPVRTRTPGGVAGAQLSWAAPYADRTGRPRPASPDATGAACTITAAGTGCAQRRLRPSTGQWQQVGRSRRWALPVAVAAMRGAPVAEITGTLNGAFWCRRPFGSTHANQPR